MLGLAFSIAGLLLVVAGVCIIVGATSLGKKMAVLAIGGWAALALLAGLSVSCRSAWLVVAVIVLGLALLAVFAKHGLLGKGAWWVAKHTVLASYYAGVWLFEHVLLRFPLAFLPTLSRGLVKLACVFLVPSLVAFAALLASRDNTSASVYFIIATPLLVVLLAGLLGKWSYRKQERKGLAHV